MTEGWRTDFAATPPFAHLQPWARLLAGTDWPSLNHLNQLAEHAALRNARGLPLRFQRQEQRCSQHDYENNILTTGRVPTRQDNWHDLLNALSWLAFPQSKAALNRVQCQTLVPGQARGAVADAATLFDESGLILVGPNPDIGRMLAERRWHEAFVGQRPAWAHTRAYVIGHAVLEKLLAPWPGITAKCLFVERGETDEAAPLHRVDEWVAQAWGKGGIGRPAQLFPVPVLGIPGWWPANADAAFYRNREVFRPARADQP